MVRRECQSTGVRKSARPVLSVIKRAGVSFLREKSPKKRKRERQERTLPIPPHRVFAERLLKKKKKEKNSLLFLRTGKV